MSDDNINIQVDVGVLKQQVTTLCLLCDKMDKVIEKLVDQHDRHISKVYADMDRRRLETESDIKEIHDRIDTVLDKLQISELRLLEEFKEMRREMAEHNKKEKETLNDIMKWKWMIAGGIIVMSWLISHINTDILNKLFA
jgi:uncharacterized protein YdiU (UPF0061 family)